MKYKIRLSKLLECSFLREVLRKQLILVFSRVNSIVGPRVFKVNLWLLDNWFLRGANLVVSKELGKRICVLLPFQGRKRTSLGLRNGLVHLGNVLLDHELVGFGLLVPALNLFHFGALVHQLNVLCLQLLESGVVVVELVVYYIHHILWLQSWLASSLNEFGSSCTLIQKSIMLLTGWVFRIVDELVGQCSLIYE